MAVSKMAVLGFASYNLERVHFGLGNDQWYWGGGNGGQYEGDDWTTILAMFSCRTGEDSLLRSSLRSPVSLPIGDNNSGCKVIDLNFHGATVHVSSFICLDLKFLSTQSISAWLNAQFFDNQNKHIFLSDWGDLICEQLHCLHHSQVPQAIA